MSYIHVGYMIFLTLSCNCFISLKKSAIDRPFCFCLFKSPLFGFSKGHQQMILDFPLNALLLPLKSFLNGLWVFTMRRYVSCFAQLCMADKHDLRYVEYPVLFFTIPASFIFYHFTASAKTFRNN